MRSLSEIIYRAFITWQEGVDAVIAITHFIKQFSVYVRRHWVNIVGITNESIFIHSSKQGIEAVFFDLLWCGHPKRSPEPLAGYKGPLCGRVELRRDTGEERCERGVKNVQGRYRHPAPAPDCMQPLLSSHFQVRAQNNLTTVRSLLNYTYR